MGKKNYSIVKCPANTSYTTDGEMSLSGFHPHGFDLSSAVAWEKMESSRPKVKNMKRMMKENLEIKKVILFYLIVSCKMGKGRSSEH